MLPQVRVHFAVHRMYTATHYLPENNVYVYFRYNETETVMVVINNNTEKQIVKTNRFQQNIKDFKTGKEIVSGQTVDISSEITIEPKSAYVLELGK